MFYSTIGRKYRVMCEDGITRVAHTTSEPDTYFSQPARVQVKGKSVSGFITPCFSHKYNFRVYTYGKNANIMPNNATAFHHWDHGDCEVLAS